MSLQDTRHWKWINELIIYEQFITAWAQLKLHKNTTLFCNYHFFTADLISNWWIFMIYRKWIQIIFFLEALQQNIFIHTEKPR